MPSTSVAPKSTLTAPGSDKRFTLFTDNWLDVQSYISSALTLPIALGDFTTKYGDFPTGTGDQLLITGCIDAMKNVKGLSASFGDPTTIKAKIANDPNYLGGTTAPDSLYGHMIWLAGQIQNQASTFTNTFDSLKMLFSGTKAENAANLKLVLTGPGGLASTASTASGQVGDLMKKLLAFDATFTAANQQLQDYTSSDSRILGVASQAVAELAKTIATTQDQANKAYKLWSDLTISAISVSVGITILTGGLLLPVGAAAGTALGIAAAKAKSSYNNLCDELTTEQAQQKQKTQLVTDLTGLNGMMIKVAPAMNAFQASLSEIEGVWVNINNNLLYIVNNYTVDQLGDLSWVMQAMQILDAQKKWQAISDSSKMFVEGSLVTYTTQTFGEKLAA